MKSPDSIFDEHAVLHDLKHYLPAQAPLKDFIHHNTLHAFQTQKFYDGLRSASTLFGYKVSLSLEEYRQLYKDGRISKELLAKTIATRKGAGHVKEWALKATSKKYDTNLTPRIGLLRAYWKTQFHVDLDAMVQPILFRTLCSYLDQGISIWNFPVLHKGFIASIREIERNTFTSFFKTSRAKNLLLKGKTDIASLLKILVGDESLYQQYLFDQQFTHQGWSGMVSAVEDQPETLLDTKKISLHDFIVFELLLEIDALDYKFGDIWSPLSAKVDEKPIDLFEAVPDTELSEVMRIWQDAYEWDYYDEVLAGLETQNNNTGVAAKTFQAYFCIDDREGSLRRYLEKFDRECSTFTTPGFFGVEFFYKPEHGKFYTKLCPAPVTPKYLVKEIDAKKDNQLDVHFTSHTHALFSGWLISQTLGFWSAFKLFLSIFKPAISPATASSFRHMDKNAKLSIENKNLDNRENGLQVGFTIDEMANRVEAVLKSTGLVKDYAPLIYIVGHGSSSVNNPHFAAYDCGACCGRPGSVNARVFSFMANHPKVRELLATRGLDIPDSTRFVGALHDTTRDEIVFFDEDQLSPEHVAMHAKNEMVFNKALDYNAKERSRRFESINSKASAAKIHEQIKRRSVSLFEPRPELNHATNSLCIVGSRNMTKELFLDRRAFTNSYDYKVDPEGKYLYNILKAAAPVCGGINLEYFFSRVDNQKLGAGTKLPHNVMGLFGVANGIDGDLRPGLPSQMIEVHDPVRLLIVVEHFPEVVLKTIQTENATYEWFINEWVHLVVINPETKELFQFKDGVFIPYHLVRKDVQHINDLTHKLETHQDNLPVYALN